MGDILKKTIPAAAIAALAALALGGCAPANSSSTQPAGEAAPALSSQAVANEVLVVDYIVGKWHCKGDTSSEWDSDVQFFGTDSNLQRSIKPDVEFQSNGVMTSLDGPGPKASVSLTEEWEYKGGVLIFGESMNVRMPEKVQIPSTTEVFIGLGGDPSKTSDADAKTDVTFEAASMTMKVAQYLDGHKAINQGQTVTCRK
jgi:hypothetical protein